jgi:hypothetical protein
LINRALACDRRSPGSFCPASCFKNFASARGSLATRFRGAFALRERPM